MTPTTQQFKARLREATAHHEARRFDRADAIYRQLSEAAPTCAVVFDLRGRLAEHQGKPEEAVRHYREAFRLDEEEAPVAVRLAGLLCALGRSAEAEPVLRRAVQKTPRSAAAWNALGFALKLQGRIADALSCHQRAVTIDPKLIEGWTHFGLTLGLAGKNHQALQHYERALALRPDHAPARYGRAQSLHKLYRLEEAIAEYDAFLKAVPRHTEAFSCRLFALQNSDAITREQLFAEHLRYGALVGTGQPTSPEHDLSPERRLRVAILSPDLRSHSCAYFLEPLVRHLDREAFELYLYHDHFLEDETSARLRQLAAVWRNFAAQPHSVVERAIREDQPDILIDLSGHVAQTVRLPILARRLAPVQITYLGYPDTTGVTTMDYRFTDGTADPVGDADRFATEKLVRFAPVAWAYQPPSDAPAVLPPQPGSAPVTFGCFNSPTKFTRTVLELWARILSTVPDSRLLLKGRDFEQAAVRDYLLRWMTDCGIPAERVELLPRTTQTADHLAQYSRIDVALDTFPYNGTTTTCEALWMGRPVVTLRGDRHAARVGASLLTAVGRSQWIAATGDEYVAIAKRVAGDRSSRIEFATEGRRELLDSPLLDHRGQSARFAAALRRCWQHRVAGVSHPAISANTSAAA